LFFDYYSIATDCDAQLLHIELTSFGAEMTSFHILSAPWAAFNLYI